MNLSMEQVEKEEANLSKEFKLQSINKLLSWVKETSLPRPARKEFWYGIFNNVTPKLDIKKQDDLLATLINILGTEIEGDEISQAFLLTKEQFNHNLFFVNDEIINKKIWPERYRFEEVREAIRRFREFTLGLTPGDYETPTLICDSDDLTIKAATLIRRDLTLINNSKVKNDSIAFNNFTSHQGFIDLTKTGKMIGIWVKPAKSIRIYAQGYLKGHLMKLRDTGGWGVRNIEKIVKYVMLRSKNTILARDNDQSFLLNRFLYPSIEMSEKRKGASIYLIDRNDWNKMCPEKKQSLNENQKYGNEYPKPASLDTKVRVSRHINLGKTIKPASKLTDAEFTMYLQQDGAIVIDKNKGEILAAGAYFVGPGGRKDIAKTVCKDVKAIAIITSQDGMIRFHSPQILSEESNDYENESIEKDLYVRLDFCP